MRFVAVGVLAAALGSAAAAGTSPATIRVTHIRPLIVAGTYFRPGETVTVIAVGTQHAVRRVVAQGGDFSVNLGELLASRCLGLRIVAVGSLGSKAVIRTPLPKCLPEPAPARAP
jgi:hypothetical protein